MRVQHIWHIKFIPITVAKPNFASNYHSWTVCGTSHPREHVTSIINGENNDLTENVLHNVISYIYIYILF